VDEKKKSKLRRFEDYKLPKYPPVEKNKHMKILAKTTSFWLMFRVSPLTKTAPFCVASVSKTLSWFFMIRIFPINHNFLQRHLTHQNTQRTVAMQKL
jgi:hypothetical protein